MASYRIEVSATAEKQLKRLDRPDQIRLLNAIQALGNEPHPRGFRKLRGYERVFRVRVGTYRILYKVEERQLLVIVLKLGHRKDIYR